MRPTIHQSSSYNNRSRVCFFLFAVESVPVSNMFSNELWLFGNTIERRSIACVVKNFSPHLFIDIPLKFHDDIPNRSGSGGGGDLEDFIQNVNDDTNGAIVKWSVEEKDQAIGFNPSKKKVVKIIYKNQSCLKKIKQVIQVYNNENACNIEIYHDWMSNFQLLIQKGLKLQSWVEISNIYKRQCKVTVCNYEYEVDFSNICLHTKDHVVMMSSPLPSSTAPLSASSSMSAIIRKPAVPPLLCCTVAIEILSSRSTSHLTVAPDWNTKEDRIILIFCRIFWLDNREKVQTYLFRDDSDEKNVIKQFEDMVNKQDIDCFIYYSDRVHPLVYSIKRIPKINLSKFDTNYVHVRDQFLRNNGTTKQYKKVYIPESVGSYCSSDGEHLSLSGRLQLDIQHAVKKLFVKPPLEAYDVHHVVCHPTILRCPVTEKDLQMYNRDSGSSSSSNQQQQQLKESSRFIDIFKKAKRRLKWYIDIEKDQNMVIGYLEISLATNLEFTKCVRNGQQVRVFNTLARKIYEDNLLLNKWILVKVPLIINRKNIDSSYPTPPYIANEPLKNVLHTSSSYAITNSAMSGKRSFQRSFGPNHGFEVGNDHKELISNKKRKIQGISESTKKSRRIGGHVMEPKCGFYKGADNAALTLDFASLYPSIMQGYRVCYRRVIYDPSIYYKNCSENSTHQENEYEFEYVSLNEDECLVLVRKYNGVDIKTFLPETMTNIVQERKRAKKMMKKCTDSFVRAALDSKQGALKILQNSFYGFLGVPERIALMACPVLMAQVCSLGRYMIQKCAYYCIKEKGAHVVYGDTDSIMVQFPIPKHIKHENDKVQYLYNTGIEVGKTCTAFFPPPNELEPETLKDPFLLLRRKMYGTKERSFDNWNGPCKNNAKGLTHLKRDRCPWVRFIGTNVLNMLLDDKHDQIIPFIKNECHKLVNRQLDINSFIQTSIIHADDKYTSVTLIQVQTAQKIAERTGKTLEPGSRISYVIVVGEEKLYQRGEDPQYVVQHKNTCKLDLKHYLKQMHKSIGDLLTYLPHIKNQFHKIIKVSFQKIQISSDKLRTFK